MGYIMLATQAQMMLAWESGIYLIKHLQAINLSCTRQNKPIFAAISFELQQNQALFIHGPNGSGKSSLLRLLTGLATPADGNILWQGKSIQENSLEYWANLHYVGHSNGIKLGLSVAENLELAAHLASSPHHQDKDFFLEQLQLTAHQHRLAKYLSAGQKRRLALAKLFLFPKNIWILDEPLTSLDEMTQRFFLTQLEKHLHEGGISIISAHHPIILSSHIQTKILRLDVC